MLPRDGGQWTSNGSASRLPSEPGSSFTREIEAGAKSRALNIGALVLGEHT